jgi:hypothetical protein
LGICAFALFLNVANIGGKIEFAEGEDQFMFFYNSGAYGHTYDDDFYPFTKFICENSERYPGKNIAIYFPGTYKRFNGIFNSFNLPEFIFYCVLALSIIFIPKLWK